MLEEIDDLLDELFERIDELLLDGKFDEVDKEIIEFDVDKESLTLSIGMLTITLTAKNRLNNRKELYERVYDKIVELGRDPYPLLVGLH